MMKLAQDIVSAVRDLEHEAEIRPVHLQTSKQNQLLFFFKPECFIANIGVQRDLIETILDTLNRFHVEISGCVAVSGISLEQSAIMDRHYGYINHMSRSASLHLKDDDKKQLLQLIGVGGSPVILGGHEVLANNPELSPKGLNDLWSTKQSVKVRGGLYGQVYDIKGTRTLIINGFHPAQLTHYTTADRAVVLMVLNSDLPWSVLRRSMIGDTFPERALPGSARRTIYERAEDLHLTDVSVANNFCHLSAGPFEALFELQNFMDPLQTPFNLENSRLVKHLQSQISPQDVSSLLKNPKLTHHPQGEDLFSATEECDCVSALHLASAFQ